MILSDWSQCPSCRLPAIYTEFKKMLENDPTCPMCEANVPAMSIQLASDPESEFKQLTALMKASGPDQEGDG
jgi:WD repeat-containing protein 19